MTVYEVDPLRDQRWNEFLERHDRASIFHTTGWLRALQQTYGYEPILFTTTPEGRSLSNGVLFCRVNSPLTGRRLVSLPFSDHCEPLVACQEELTRILSHVVRQVVTAGNRYIEIRPLELRECPCEGFFAHQSYQFHSVDLRPSMEQLHQRLHKNSFQRKIQRAEREGLTSVSGTTCSEVNSFYRLFVMTRRRHGLPPPPVDWLRSLIHHLGNAVQIWLILKDEQPVAGMLTLVHKDTIMYKYGGSDSRYAHLGGMPFAFWAMMRQAKERGLLHLDLGRCEADNAGLITYKDRLGSARSTMTYWRAPQHSRVLSDPLQCSKIARRICASFPDSIRILAGKLLYRHCG